MAASAAVAIVLRMPETIMIERLRRRSAITPPASENTTDGSMKESMTQVRAMGEAVMS